MKRVLMLLILVLVLGSYGVVATDYKDEVVIKFCKPSSNACVQLTAEQVRLMSLNPPKTETNYGSTSGDSIFITDYMSTSELHFYSLDSDYRVNLYGYNFELFKSIDWESNLIGPYVIDSGNSNGIFWDVQVRPKTEAKVVESDATGNSIYLYNYCNDGKDNDGDGKTDLEDPDCSIYTPITFVTPCDPLNIDCSKPECADQSFSFSPTGAQQDSVVEPVCGSENDYGRCNDDIDNDNNGKIDCKETACQGFNFCSTVPGTSGCPTKLGAGNLISDGSTDGVGNQNTYNQKCLDDSGNPLKNRFDQTLVPVKTKAFSGNNPEGWYDDYGCCPGTNYCVSYFAPSESSPGNTNCYCKDGTTIGNYYGGYCVDTYCYAPGSMKYSGKQWYCAPSYNDASYAWVGCDNKLKDTVTPDGKYQCDGTAWIKAENCTNGIDDNFNGKIDCADVSCKDRIGAYFNTSGCTDPKGCKCEYPKETICNDGFDNDRLLKVDTLCKHLCSVETTLCWKKCPDPNNNEVSNDCKTACAKSFSDCQTTCADNPLLLSDCFDPDCLGSLGPKGAKCCYLDAVGAKCGVNRELIETDCNENSNDEDGDGLANCADLDCNLQLCSGTDRNQKICSQGQCLNYATAGTAPVVQIQNITFTTYTDLLKFLHSGKVVTSTTPTSCNLLCAKSSMLCGFAQGGKKTCQQQESTKCTCYPILERVSIPEATGGNSSSGSFPINTNIFS